MPATPTANRDAHRNQDESRFGRFSSFRLIIRLLRLTARKTWCRVVLLVCAHEDQFLAGDRGYEEVSRVNGRIDACRRRGRMPVRRVVRLSSRRAGDASRYLRRRCATGSGVCQSGCAAAGRIAVLVRPRLHVLRQHAANTIRRARLCSPTGNLKGRPCLAENWPARHGEGGPLVLSLVSSERCPAAINDVHSGGQQPPECLISAARARSA